MAKSKRVFISLTLVGCVIAVGLITAALATDYWIVAKPEQKLRSQNETSSGSVNFGLFHGNQILDYRGAREKEIWVKDYAIKYGMFDYSIWVATIAMAALGIAWGLIAFGFGCFNVLSHPIETITGPVGLYVWNAIAALFTLLCVILYTVLYYQDLKVNVLQEDDAMTQWTSKDLAWPGFSFWLVVGATLAYTINILFVFLAGVNLRLPRYSHTAEKNLDGVMMY